MRRRKESFQIEEPKYVPARVFLPEFPCDLTDCLEITAMAGDHDDTVKTVPEEGLDITLQQLLQSRSFDADRSKPDPEARDRCSR